MFRLLTLESPIIPLRTLRLTLLLRVSGENRTEGPDKPVPTEGMFRASLRFVWCVRLL